MPRRGRDNTAQADATRSDGLSPRRLMEALILPWADYADAVLRISFARRSSRFSLASSAIRCPSTVVVPSRTLESISALVTRLCNVSGLTPVTWPSATASGPLARGLLRQRSGRGLQLAVQGQAAASFSEQPEGGEIQQKYARVGTQESDNLFAQAIRELDPDKARETANRTDVLNWKEVHSLPLYQRPDVVAATDGLANYGRVRVATVRYQDVGFTE
jgi:hypothetical protein